MIQEILYPFGINPHTGGIAVTTDPSAIAQQHVQALISTSPGERVMLSDYGVPSSSALFQNGTDAVIASLTSDIQQQMSFWEPNLKLLGINPFTDPNNEIAGFAGVQVNFSISNDDTTVNQATVEVGGNVIESVVNTANPVVMSVIS